jgi:hypothetical protein
VPGPFDKARGIDALILKKAGDLPPERIVTGNAGKMAGKPPAAKGHQGCGYGPAALNDQVAELAFRVRGRPGGNAPDIVEGTLAEAKDVHSVCPVLTKSRSFIFLAPPRERIEVRGIILHAFSPSP